MLLIVIIIVWLLLAFSKPKDRSNEKHAVATERNHLRHSLRSAKVSHNQLLEIQNKCINGIV